MTALVPGMSQLPWWLEAVVSASLYATVVAGLVVGVQLVVGRRVPARWRFALWFLVLARLVPMPLPESRVSVFNLVPAAPAVTGGEVLPVDGALWVPAEVPVVREARDSAAPEVAETVVAPDAPRATLGTVEIRPPELKVAVMPTAAARPIAWGWWVAMVYVLGAGAFTLRHVLATVALRRILRGAVPADDGRLLTTLEAARRTLGVRQPVPLLISGTLSSPALVGIWRPRLLLPADLAAALSTEDLRHVFLHECAHLRRHDVLLNYVVAALSVLHWFNPVVHLLMPRLRADRELAADELVLAHAEPAAYGQTLLNVFEAGATACRAPASVAITETRSFFARRIHMIAGFKRQPAWVSVPAMIALLGAGACALTGPVSQAGEVPARRVETVTAATPEGGVATRPAVTATAAPGGTPKAGAMYESVYQTPTQAAADRANEATRARLERPLKDFEVFQQSLGKVLEMIADEAGVHFQTNWRTMQAAGIDRNTPVTARLGGAPVRRALQVALSEAGNGVDDLGYTVEDGVVLVSTLAELRGPQHLTTRVYNIRPFLANSAVVDQRVVAIVRLIQSNVEPNTWRDNGGQVGAISEFNGLLTINTSSDIHHRISELLGTMMQADAATTGAGAVTVAADRPAAGSRTISTKVQLAGAAMDHAANLLGSVLQQLGSLTEMQMKLEQERAAMMAVSGAANPVELKVLDARLETVKRQLAETQEKLAKAQADAENQTGAATVRGRASAGGEQVEGVRRMYDVRALIGWTSESRGLTAESRGAMDDIVKAVGKFVGPEDTVTGFGGTIIVVAPPKTLDKVGELLAELQRQQSR